MKRPSFQFYPADWRKDAELQSCSIAARGLWVEMLCIMHESSLYGHLAINGKPMTAAQLGRLVGESEKAIKALLDELEGAGVFSTSDGGCIFSRRMVKDEEVRNIKAEAGKGGKEFGVLGAEHGKKGGRPKKDRGDIKTPHITPHQEENKTPEEPPPSSSSSSSSSSSEEEKIKRTPKADAFGVLQILETFPTLDESVANDFVKHRKNKRAPLTQSAWDAIAKEIMASGWTPDRALREAMARGWQAFKADWVAEKPQRFGSKQAPEDISNWVPASMRGTPDDPLYDGDYIDAIQ